MKVNKIIAVIGFPKSGNTWISRIIRQLVNGSIYVEDKNKHINVDNSELRGTQETLIIKRHDSSLHGFENFLKKKKIVSEDIKYIYVRRNIRDVVLSGFSFNYPRLHKYRKSFLLRPFLAYETKKLSKVWGGPFWERWYRSILNPDDNLYQQVGNWKEHLKHWGSLENVTQISYESLLADPLNSIKNLVDEIDLNCNETFIKKVIEEQSFATKKKMFKKNNDKVNDIFLRKGISGYWEHELPKSTAAFIQKKYGNYID